METLDEMAHDGDLNSLAYDRLAKRLKHAFEANECAHERLVDKVAISYAVQAPWTLMFAPPDVDFLSHAFVRDLTRAKRAAMAASQAPAAALEQWLADVVEHYMGPVNSGLEDSCVRLGMLLLLEADAELFGEPVVHHLDTILTDRCRVCLFEGEPDVYLPYLETLAPAVADWVGRTGRCCGCAHSSD